MTGLDRAASLVHDNTCRDNQHDGPEGGYPCVELAREVLKAGDEYHSMDELYEYRMLYNAHAARGWLTAGIPVVKSRRHSDGEPCFGGGWFIVVATLPTGQVSNHYADEHWDLFDVPEVDLPPEYDGHTPADAARRLREHVLTAQPAISVEQLFAALAHYDSEVERAHKSLMGPSIAILAGADLANGIRDILKDAGLTVAGESDG